jgi:hypothetical protein
MRNKALILLAQEGDWEGLFINGELVQEGETFWEGTHPFIYILRIAEKYSLLSEDITVEYLSCEDDEYLTSVGRFPKQLSELKGNY